MSGFVLIALPILCAAGPAHLHARQIALGRTQECAACGITVDRVVTLGEAEGPGSVGLPAGVGRLRSGDWVVAQLENSAQIALFGSDGTFRGRVGRSGAGPAEYRWITFLDVTADDSVRVYDAGLGRLTVLDRELGARRHVRLGIKGPQDIAFGRTARSSQRWS